jgi:hypothetical protein
MGILQKILVTEYETIWLCSQFLFVFFHLELQGGSKRHRLALGGTLFFMWENIFSSNIYYTWKRIGQVLRGEIMITSSLCGRDQIDLCIHKTCLPVCVLPADAPFRWLVLEWQGHGEALHGLIKFKYLIVFYLLLFLVGHIIYPLDGTFGKAN